MVLSKQEITSAAVRSIGKFCLYVEIRNYEVNIDCGKDDQDMTDLNRLRTGLLVCEDEEEAFELIEVFNDPFDFTVFVYNPQGEVVDQNF